jgi:hypothetical protein
MKYCLDFEQTMRIAPQLLESILPGHDYSLGLAEALKAVGSR